MITPSILAVILVNRWSYYLFLGKEGGTQWNMWGGGQFHFVICEFKSKPVLTWEETALWKYFAWLQSHLITGCHRNLPQGECWSCLCLNTLFTSPTLLNCTKAMSNLFLKQDSLALDSSTVQIQVSQEMMQLSWLMPLLNSFQNLLL